ncbi:tyrosine-type recombinase/integrase [Lichenihabitans psoromatis]|uniref:tyrosine-type recombinase/integrase n=1 Tax=Lichenihabitans psoromatis TaxID=2528642 RepID=UPI001036E28D|nr:site-specific integrase [Lichenihabitans psoromatis]
MASVAKREWTHNGESKFAWVVRYVDEAGKRRMRTFERKKEADKFRTHAETEVEAGTHTPRSVALRMSEICELFLRYSEGRLRDGKIGKGCHQNLTMIVDQSIVPRLGGRLITDLTFKDIEAWYEWLAKVKRYSPSTMTHRMRTLQQVESFAFRRKLIRKKVIAEFLAEIGRPPIDPIRTFSKGEILHLLKTAESTDRVYKPACHLLARLFVNLAGCCGLRHGEIAGLTLCNVDLELGIIHVRHRLTKFDDLKSPKTISGLRDVPMPEHIRTMLREWVTLFYKVNDRELLFQSERGGSMHSICFHAGHWKPLLVRAGYNGKDGWPHFHALRHFAASFMISTGMPMPDVASLLGHKKFDTTLQIYAHPIVGGGRHHEIIQSMAAQLMPLATQQGRNNGQQTIDLATV